MTTAMPDQVVIIRWHVQLGFEIESDKKQSILIVSLLERKTYVCGSCYTESPYTFSVTRD